MAAPVDRLAVRLSQVDCQPRRKAWPAGESMAQNPWSGAEPTVLPTGLWHG